jgi:hypothetical protein
MHLTNVVSASANQLLPAKTNPSLYASLGSMLPGTFVSPVSANQNAPQTASSQ